MNPFYIILGENKAIYLSESLLHIWRLHTWENLATIAIREGTLLYFTYRMRNQLVTVTEEAVQVWDISALTESMQKKQEGPSTTSNPANLIQILKNCFRWVISP